MKLIKKVIILMMVIISITAITILPASAACGLAQLHFIVKYNYMISFK